MKFKANLKNIVLYGYHGLFQSEREKGQNFEIDVEYFYDIDGSQLNDDIENTIDYTEIYNTVKAIFQKKKYKLLESLAMEIASTLKKEFSLLVCRVKIRKPEVIMSGEIKYVPIGEDTGDSPSNPIEVPESEFDDEECKKWGHAILECGE